MSRFFQIKDNLILNITKYKKLLLMIMLANFVITIGCLMTRGVNYGIDFKGGLSIEAQIPENTDYNVLRGKLNGAKIGDFSLQQFGDKNTIMIKIESLADDSDGSFLLSKLKSALGDDIVYRNIENVGPKVGESLKKDSMIAVFFALFAILVYIWIRFDWQFGVCGVVALLHDCIVLLGFYSIFNCFDFNMASVVAILMTAGYSINDTVVIFDRMNENINAQKYDNMHDLINTSIAETLSRTLLTSFTTALALINLCIFGGSVIFTYAFPILIGITVGTFSSIFIAAPLMLYTNFKIQQKQK